MDGSPPGSSAHGILQARILQWVAIPFSRGSSLPRDWTWVSCIAGRVFTVWDMQDLPGERMDGCMDGEREVGGWNMDLLAATHPLPSRRLTKSPFILFSLQSVGPPCAFTENILKKAIGALLFISIYMAYWWDCPLYYTNLGLVLTGWKGERLLKFLVTHQLVVLKNNWEKEFLLENIF